MAIEQARFPDRLRPTFDIGEGLDAVAVPSFALQHLVENAIRHGIAKRSGAGTVEIRARRDGNTLELTIADDGTGVGEGWVPPAGRGLATTRERLRGLYGDRAALDIGPRGGAGTVARLRVPYREIERSADDGER